LLHRASIPQLRIGAAVTVPLEQDAPRWYRWIRRLSVLTDEGMSHDELDW